VRERDSAARGKGAGPVSFSFWWTKAPPPVHTFGQVPSLSPGEMSRGSCSEKWKSLSHRVQRETGVLPVHGDSVPHR
jgi:hypothetical protein